MVKAREFLENTVSALSKPLVKAGVMAGMALSMALGNPQQAMAQDEIDLANEKRDARAKKEFWMFGVGASIVPDQGANFDFHGGTPGFGKKGSKMRQWNQFEAGARLTGQSIGSAVVFRVPGQSINYAAWSQQFSTAYFRWMIGPHVKLPHGWSARAGVGAEFTSFPGRQWNLFNNTDVSAVAQVGVTKNILGPVAAFAEAKYTAATKVSEFSTNRFWGGIATDQQINNTGGATFNVGLAIKL